MMSVENVAREMIAALRAASEVARRDTRDLDELREEIEEALFRGQPPDPAVFDLLDRLARSP
jgi:hypothetical protein